MNIRNLQSEANQFWDEMRWDEMRWDEMRWDEMRWDEREVDFQSTWILDSNQYPLKAKKIGKILESHPTLADLQKKLKEKKTNSFLSAWLERFLRFRYLLIDNKEPQNKLTPSYWSHLEVFEVLCCCRSRGVETQKGHQPNFKKGVVRMKRKLFLNFKATLHLHPLKKKVEVNQLFFKSLGVQSRERGLSLNGS